MLKNIMALLVTPITVVCLATAPDVSQAPEANLDSVNGIIGDQKTP